MPRDPRIDAQRLRDALDLLERVRDSGYLNPNSALWHDCDRMVRGVPRPKSAKATNLRLITTKGDPCKP